MKPLANLCLIALLASGSIVHGEETEDVSPVIAIVGETRIEEAEKEDLGDRVLVLLLEKYAAEHELAATDEEVSKFLATMEAGEKEDQARAAKRKAELEVELESAELDADARAEKTAELATLTELSDSPEEALSDEETKQLAELRDGMARSVIQSWKVNRALFAEYGGRVIYQQMGPEPLDAYRKFLEAQLKAGAFKLADAKYEAELWGLFTDEELHDFVPEDQRARLIQTSPWERNDDEE